MLDPTGYPLELFGVSFIVLWLAARIGWLIRRKQLTEDEEIREDFGLILAATLTMLGLLIGFSFSMAANRYDERKNYEEAEANAIGTEYVRADLLSAEAATKIRALLGSYLDQRILFYKTRDENELRQINDRTAQLQAALWSEVIGPAEARPTAVAALAVSGMNDVLNSQGYTQAGFWNRIPVSAWGLMAAIAVGCNALVGYGARRVATRAKLLPILPLVVSTAFMLVADIDTPRHGIIRVHPQNLMSLAESLRAPAAPAKPISAGQTP